MRQGFDNDRYIELQSANIRRRIDEFGGKLYLEFGGKLFDDFHASRVLPGFLPDTKIRMLENLKDESEVLLVISANDIESNKIRGDLGITYDEDVLRLLDAFRELGFLVNGVVITHYAGQERADIFRNRLSGMGIVSYLHYPIVGYPHDLAHIVSDEGFGRNEFVETTRPLVVVTAPGPGSGKLATCLSQLYGEYKRGVMAGYAKFETFPIWNLPLKHPVNLAYEAATVDLDDVNMIDPFHMDVYGQMAVNYNRDVEAFPILRAMMTQIAGASPYQSPTDMGVNMAGYAICDDEACCEASRMEIFRRYFEAANKVMRYGGGTTEVSKIESIMTHAEINLDISVPRKVALAKMESTGGAAAAMMLPDGRVVTGKTSDLLGPASSCLMNALKTLADIEDEKNVLTDEAIEPICRLKTEFLGSRNPRLHTDETLIALSISSATDPDAQAALSQLGRLEGSDAFFSTIPSQADEKIYKSLGISLSYEPEYERRGYYHR